ncbi:hypothetical protein AAIE21_28225 [Paenibacillus sp. 102]|uniref:hypothetical protein n=1 Tax=Paenibacillus sp. 102 TaxID=3120823 RepID=UPI0031BAA45E
MELKLQDLTQEEMLNIDGGKGSKSKQPKKKRDWESIIDYGIEAGKWIYKNAGSAGQVDSRYKHGAPGRKF